MIPRFIGLQRLPARILSTPRLGITQATARNIIVDPSANNDPAINNPVRPNDAMSVWGKMDWTSDASPTGKFSITNRGSIIPEGKWEVGIKKANDRWNRWLVVAIVGWCLTTYYAMTEYNLIPTKFFPMSICAERDVRLSHMTFKDTDCTKYYQNYDEVLPEGDEDEEEDDD